MSDNSNFMEVINYDCPLCDSEHDIEVRKRKTQTIVKDTAVEHKEIYYYCKLEDGEFVPAYVMDKNLLSAKDEYRRINKLLTSSEIKAIREMYGLSQKEFSNMLGWGDVTIQRYEKKLIQDETYDQIMRMVAENPSFALQELNKHNDKFPEERFQEIKETVKGKIKEKGNLVLKLQQVSNYYVDYEEKCDSNGFKLLDTDKVANVICYFAHYIKPLYKVKLMKLLWYTDALNFKLHGCSMTGLVYKHLPMGAVPLGHEEILSFPAVEVVEEYFKGYIGYKVHPKVQIAISEFTLDELNVLQKVANFFKDMKTEEIVEYMHEEKAYMHTSLNEVIPFELAKDIRNF